ncbi:hypothetical protein BV22DRAFT_1135013 [Leucogyrophana mollusca]|uniref:Uncharacterized protein n=1 Tax=Leucogyrophana mollusca TaxID=85980 RepID=A0ACB8AZP6_9AGAM|nr:hypothetical protein BV22DRAFT_1135013 [Leucogyrophana mollusca]
MSFTVLAFILIVARLAAASDQSYKLILRSANGSSETHHAVFSDFTSGVNFCGPCMNHGHLNDHLQSWEFTTRGFSEKAIVDLRFYADADCKSEYNELSNINDFDRVRTYLVSQGRVNGTGKITVGLAFWLYPTGLHGPFHVNDAGVVVEHGTLITLERGALFEEAFSRVKASFRVDGIAHEHIAAPSSSSGL